MIFVMGRTAAGGVARPAVGTKIKIMQKMTRSIGMVILSNLFCYVNYVSDGLTGTGRPRRANFIQNQTSHATPAPSNTTPPEANPRVSKITAATTSDALIR